MIVFIWLRLELYPGKIMKKGGEYIVWVNQGIINDKMTIARYDDIDYVRLNKILDCIKNINLFILQHFLLRNINYMYHIILVTLAHLNLVTLWSSIEEMRKMSIRVINILDNIWITRNIKEKESNNNIKDLETNAQPLNKFLNSRGKFLVQFNG